jgi:hypothetical protein
MSGDVIDDGFIIVGSGDNGRRRVKSGIVNINSELVQGSAT